MPQRLVIIGQRKRGLAHEECVQYLETKHVPVIKQLSGLERLVTSRPRRPESAGYDVMFELWFKDTDHLESAFSSPKGERVVEDAENFIYFSDAVRFAVTDERLRYQDVPEGLV